MMTPLNLPEFRLLKAEENDRDYRYTVEKIEEPKICPNCLVIDGKYYKHGKKDREVWDLDAQSKRVKIVIKQRRYKCVHCGHAFYETIDSVDVDRKITRRLYNRIQEDGLADPFTKVAQRYGISNMTVRRAVDDFIDKHDKDRKLAAPRVIGIDEAHLNKVYRGVITDIENLKLLEMTETNAKWRIKDCINSMEGYKNIEIACMDMAPAYKYAMKELVPKAFCIIDKFHVIKKANEAMEAVRIKIKNSLTKEQKQLLKYDRWTLLHKKESLSVVEMEKRDRWFAMFPELATAYWLKEGLRDIYEANDRYEAYQMYHRWESSIPSNMKEFKEVAKTINDCKAEVFNYFLHRYTNAFTESINNQIKRMEKAGNGYSYEVLRAKALYKNTFADVEKYGTGGFRTIYDIDQNNIVLGEKVKFYRQNSTLQRGLLVGNF